MCAFGGRSEQKEIVLALSKALILPKVLSDLFYKPLILLEKFRA